MLAAAGTANRKGHGKDYGLDLRRYVNIRKHKEVLFPRDGGNKTWAKIERWGEFDDVQKFPEFAGWAGCHFFVNIKITHFGRNRTPKIILDIL